MSLLVFVFSNLISTTLIFQVLAAFLYHTQFLSPERIEELLGVKKGKSIAPTQTDDNERSDRVTPVELGKLADKILSNKMKEIASYMGIDDASANHVLTDSVGSFLFNFSILTLWTNKSTGNNRKVTNIVVFIVQM